MSKPHIVEIIEKARVRAEAIRRDGKVVAIINGPAADDGMALAVLLGRLVAEFAAANSAAKIEDGCAVLTDLLKAEAEVHRARIDAGIVELRLPEESKH